MQITNQVSYDITLTELKDILIRHFKVDIEKNITELAFDFSEDEYVTNISFTIKNKA